MEKFIVIYDNSRNSAKSVTYFESQSKASHFAATAAKSGKKNVRLYRAEFLRDFTATTWGLTDDEYKAIY